MNKKDRSIYRAKGDSIMRVSGTSGKIVRRSDMIVRPFTLKQANAYIEEFHRHHKKVTGHRFSSGLYICGKLSGVCVVGRPVARNTDQYRVAEVTRLCTDGSYNACSFLYANSAKVCKIMGFLSIQTYTLPSEGGASLRAAGWLDDGETPGGSWSSESRPRKDKHPLGKKTRWVKHLNERYDGESTK